MSFFYSSSFMSESNEITNIETTNKANWTEEQDALLLSLAKKFDSVMPESQYHLGLRILFVQDFVNDGCQKCPKSA